MIEIINDPLKRAVASVIIVIILTLVYLGVKYLLHIKRTKKAAIIISEIAVHLMINTYAEMTKIMATDILNKTFEETSEEECKELAKKLEIVSNNNMSSIESIKVALRPARKKFKFILRQYKVRLYTEIVLMPLVADLLNMTLHDLEAYISEYVISEQAKARSNVLRCTLEESIKEINKTMENISILGGGVNAD